MSSASALSPNFFISLTSASLSFFGCTFIIVAFLCIQERRRPIQRLIFFLTISDLLASLARIISHILRGVYHATSNKGSEAMGLIPGDGHHLRDEINSPFNDALAGQSSSSSFSSSSLISSLAADGSSWPSLESFVRRAIENVVTTVIGDVTTSMSTDDGGGRNFASREDTSDLKWSCNYSVTIVRFLSVNSRMIYD